MFYILYFFGGRKNLNRYKKSIKNHTANYTNLDPDLIIESFQIMYDDYNIYDRLGVRPSCSHLLKLCKKIEHSRAKSYREATTN
jgi:hypothetical protein